MSGSAVQEEVSVSMSHSFAKIMAASLTAAVAAVEKEVGTIKLPWGGDKSIEQGAGKAATEYVGLTGRPDFFVQTRGSRQATYLQPFS